MGANVFGLPVLSSPSGTSITKPVQHDISPVSSVSKFVDITRLPSSILRLDEQRPTFGKFLKVPIRTGENKQSAKRPATPESPKFLTVPKWKYGSKNKGRARNSDSAPGAQTLGPGDDGAGMNSDSPVKPLVLKSDRIHCAASLNVQDGDAQDHPAPEPVKELGDEDSLFSGVDQLLREIQDLQKEFKIWHRDLILPRIFHDFNITFSLRRIPIDFWHKKFNRVEAYTIIPITII